MENNVNESRKTELFRNMSYESIISGSKKFQQFRIDCIQSVKMSVTGITNLVVGYEDPCLVDSFLKSCFAEYELYRGSYDIDAVELQKGSPGRGFSTAYIDALIYGNCEEETDALGISTPKVDVQTGKRKRNPTGFINRPEVLQSKNQDRTLIIKNIDYSLDFCQSRPGEIDSRSLWIFDNFRKPSEKLNCRLLLVSNVPIKFPFKVRTLTLDKVDEYEASLLLNSFISKYKKGKYKVSFSTSQHSQIVRKICGLTYTEAADTIAEAMSIRAVVKEGEMEIDSIKVVKNIRSKVNRNLMQDAVGLTCLTPRPWNDYICPENSNFTFDVKKILRDFKEIDYLKAQSENLLKNGKDDSIPLRISQAIRSRMPHIIVLYGKGGVGKCLGRGTKVMMFDGDTKNAEDVVVGDLLMGPDSKPRTVLSITHGIGPMYRVDQKNGVSYECNDAHILSLKNAKKSSDREPVFISAEDFCKKSKHWKECHNGWKTGVEFVEQELPIDPYLMGLWLGDVDSLNNAISVGHKEVSCGLDAGNFSPRKGSDYCINDIKNSLKDLKVLDNKHIPNIYWKNSSRNRLELLSGLLDSCGYMTVSGSLKFKTVNKRLSTDVLHLVRSLGFKGFLRESVKGIKKTDYSVKAYTVTIDGDLSRIPIKLSKKQGQNSQEKLLKCGITVTPIGTGEYFGFTINGDRQFLLGDFTVTHNSAFPIHFAGLLDFDVWDFNVTATHSKWVGEGPERMREAINKISRASHLVVRIDEYDRAIGATGSSGQGMHEAHKQVEAEFMNWLQNSQEEGTFVKNDIFVVLTTNHKENITGPLLRSGRADLVIDINEFDTKSMKETFLSAPRRMDNRGITVVGYNDRESLEKSLRSLDLDRLAAIASQRGFTVRDVDIIIQEMAAHDYYYNRTGSGIKWTTDNFVKVLENSEGSVKGENTSELIIGDRFLLDQPVKEDNQGVFEFFGECSNSFDLDKFMQGA